MEFVVGRKLSRKNVVNWELLVGVFTARAAALLIPLTAGQQLQTRVRSHKYFSVIFALSFALIIALYLAIC